MNILSGRISFHPLSRLVVRMKRDGAGRLQGRRRRGGGMYGKYELSMQGKYTSEISH
jgi:hypothetical protein